MRVVRAALAAAVVCLQAAAYAPAAQAQGENAVPLRFDEMAEATPKGVEPSAKLRSLSGKRVRMVGYMAHQEAPPTGAFFLCPRPVYNDESGAGTGDIPPSSVLVVVRSARGQQIEPIARPVEVTGILELGRKEEEDGTTSFVRILLDRPEDVK